MNTKNINEYKVAFTSPLKGKDFCYYDDIVEAGETCNKENRPGTEK